VKFRRRYQVVVEGVSGQATAQRTVISEHRSESEAVEAARIERSRLEVIHGGGAASWRILVMLDQQIVAEEVPQAEGEDLLNGRAREDAPEAEAPVEPEPGRPDEPEESDQGEEPARAPAEPDERDEPPPEGRVPDWVIQRFEDSITRRGEREERAPEGDGEGPSQPLP
jgi:hypothetical protein